MSEDTLIDDTGTNEDTVVGEAVATEAPSTTEAAPTDGVDETVVVADWRERLSGGDDKLKGYLARVPSEKALVEQVKRHSDDLKAGKYIKPLPENPTDDEMAEWRAAMQVPEKPGDYLQSLPEGLVVGDDDRPYVDKFLEKMHGSNAPPAMATAALESYYDIVEEQAAAQADAANVAKNESIELLREEWGPDYKRNLNVMHGFLDGLPEPVADAFRGGTGPDGLPLGYNAEILKWLTSQAMEANPVATVVPGAGSNQTTAIGDEIASLEAKMGNRQSDYWKGPTSAKNQARYLELVDARTKLAARG